MVACPAVPRSGIHGYSLLSCKEKEGMMAMPCLGYQLFSLLYLHSTIFMFLLYSYIVTVIPSFCHCSVLPYYHLNIPLFAIFYYFMMILLYYSIIKRLCYYTHIPLFCYMFILFLLFCHVVVSWLYCSIIPLCYCYIIPSDYY